MRTAWWVDGAVGGEEEVEGPEGRYWITTPVSAGTPTSDMDVGPSVSEAHEAAEANDVALRLSGSSGNMPSLEDEAQARAAVMDFTLQDVAPTSWVSLQMPDLGMETLHPEDVQSMVETIDEVFPRVADVFYDEDDEAAGHGAPFVPHEHLGHLDDEIDGNSHLIHHLLYWHGPPDGDDSEYDAGEVCRGEAMGADWRDCDRFSWSK
jgi:hypothetical protein